MPNIGDIRKGSEIGKYPKVYYQWLACIDCGKERWVIQRGAKRITASKCFVCSNKTPRVNRGSFLKGRFGENHPAWKGGRTKTKEGYIIVKLPLDDFFRPMCQKSGHIFEHRLVVAKALNRCLLPWEIVHHKEGYAKDDNRYPETLQLITGQQFHIVDSVVKAYIKRLQKRVTLLGAELTLLKGERRIKDA